MMLSGTGNTSFIIKDDGSLWGCGWNYDYELGLGDTTNRDEFVRIGTDKWKQICCGDDNVMGIKVDGSLWAWGNNEDGQLGLGHKTTPVKTPTQVGTDTNWASVHTFESHTMALKTDGTLWGCGNNADGQLGNGTTTSRTTFAKIGSNTWKQVSCASGFTIGIRSDGYLYGWGVNWYGQLGQPKEDYLDKTSSPLRIGSSTWKTVQAVGQRVIGIASNGYLYAWGGNINNCLNVLGYDIRYYSPTRIGTATYKEIYSGSLTTVVMRSDNTLWAWGDNGNGEAGTDSYIPVSSLTQVATSSNWDKVLVCGMSHYIASKTDGTLWGWGYNLGGQLGLNDNSDRRMPTLISGFSVGNSPPTKTQIPAQTVNVGTPATINLNNYFSDPEGSALTYTVSSSSTSVATVSRNGGTLTITAKSVGSTTISVSASDSEGGTASQTFTVTVPNQNPTKTQIPTQSISMNRTKTINLSSYFSDPDGNALTYTATSSNTSVVTVSTSGSTLTINSKTISSSATITVTANDGNSGTASQTFTVNVANQNPTKTQIPTQNMFRNKNTTINLSSYFSDPDGDTLTYTISSSDTNVAAVSRNGNILTINSKNIGSSTITISVNDGYSGTASQTFVVNVTNQAPTVPGTFNSLAGLIEHGDIRNINWGISTDPDGDSISYILEVSLNGGVWSQLTTTTSNNYSYTFPVVSSVRFRVKTRDSIGAESSYQTGNLYTVVEPLYHWSKYNVITTKKLNYQSLPSIAIDNSKSSDNTLNSLSDDSNTVLTEITVNGSKKNPDVKNFVVVEIEVNGKNASNLISTYITDNVSFSVFDLKLDTLTGNINLTYVANTNDELSSLTPEKYYYYKYSSGTYDIKAFKLSADLATLEIYNVSVVNDSNIRGTFITNLSGTYNAYLHDQLNSDGYWYIRGPQISKTVAPPSGINVVSEGVKLKSNEKIIVNIGSSPDTVVLYEIDYKYNNENWTPLSYDSSLSRELIITPNTAFTNIQFRVRSQGLDSNSNYVYSNYIYSKLYDIEHNSLPTITIKSPDDHVTLYNNTEFNITGTVLDQETIQGSVIYVQVDNNEPFVIASNTSLFNKKLGIKDTRMVYGSQQITNSLQENKIYTLKIWAEDDKAGKSNIVERRFYMVLNIAPDLVVHDIIPKGILDTDKLAISGFVSDVDSNPSIEVFYTVNNDNKVKIYNGSGGPWEFNILLSQLKVGENLITIEAVDNHNFKTSKVIKLNKKGNKHNYPISVARYRLKPIEDKAKSVLLFIQRDEELEIEVSLSMVNQDEVENYVVLKPEYVSPIISKAGKVVEDTYYYEALSEKDDIVLKIVMKTMDEADKYKIYMISGVME